MKTKPRSSLELEPALTVEDAAVILDTCTKTVRRRIAAGEIAVVLSGRHIRSPEDHKRFLVRNRHG